MDMMKEYGVIRDPNSGAFICKVTPETKKIEELQRQNRELDKKLNLILEKLGASNEEAH